MRATLGRGKVGQVDVVSPLNFRENLRRLSWVNQLLRSVIDTFLRTTCHLLPKYAVKQRRIDTSQRESYGSTRFAADTRVICQVP